MLFNNVEDVEWSMYFFLFIYYYRKTKQKQKKEDKKNALNRGELF